MLTHELYYLRHAETNLNATGYVVGGRSNHAELSELGKRQAVDLGHYLLDQAIVPTRVIATPAVRTQHTAQLTLGVMGVTLTPEIDDSIQELDQGKWTGYPRNQIYTPAVMQRIETEGKDFSAPGGESMNDCSRRMVTFMDKTAVELTESTTPERIFVFGHGMVLRCLAAHIFGWSRQQIADTVTPNTSLSLFTFSGTDWNIAYIGRKPE